MWVIWIICGLIVVAVLALSLFTTHKGYEYKHTVDPLPDEPFEENQKQEKKNSSKSEE